MVISRWGVKGRYISHPHGVSAGTEHQSTSSLFSHIWQKGEKEDGCYCSQGYLSKVQTGCLFFASHFSKSRGCMREKEESFLAERERKREPLRGHDADERTWGVSTRFSSTVYIGYREIVKWIRLVPPVEFENKRKEYSEYSQSLKRS